MAAAWLLLPWWAFLVVALFCYFAPLFRPLSLAPAFIVFLILALAAHPGFLSAIYAALVLALIFGIKDLVIVNRKMAYEILVSLLAFAGFLLLFGTFQAWSLSASFLFLALACLLWFWLIRSAPEGGRSAALPSAIATLLLFEIGAIMFFLPASFFYQSALLFFASALLFEAATRLPVLSFRQVAIWGGAYAGISILVVFLASWKV